MSGKVGELDQILINSEDAIGNRESAALQALRAATASHQAAHNQISVTQGQLLAMLVRISGAKRCLDCGVFTGYSACVVAEALPADGVVHACDVDGKTMAVARTHWQRAGVMDRIESVVSTMDDYYEVLIQRGMAGSFDFIFIDANKKACERYFEYAMILSRPGGIIVVDDVLQQGRVMAPKENDWCARAMQSFIASRQSDERVHICTIPIGDGMMVMQKSHTDPVIPAKAGIQVN